MPGRYSKPCFSLKFWLFGLTKRASSEILKILLVIDMCLKTDTIPLQYTLHQFQYFITHLCTVDIYQQILQSNSFNENDLMVLFNWGWSRLINKLTLIKTLNLLASEARISKWSKSIEQLHSRRWSDTADCLTLLRRFPVKLDIPVCSAAIVKCWWHVLP